MAPFLIHPFHALDSKIHQRTLETILTLGITHTSEQSREYLDYS
ncbi:protein of unknown function [Magnetospirillum gryphiswaldense MSR-1 v2]|uniref:Uncharacterized protein n=1 Tax=Magnetospirillum gryphiswaldense (strain DSM 6361 / JCM 21280 / NBRC 15271 / MSR-1) TaxID=431944 RepID=V6EW23_MAGGM|nr:protein of unknown function [Magnetospirillum gryphiswaldense MSR-1 v2]